MGDVFGFPEECFCPLGFEVMQDPVFTADGHTYERDQIETWFENNDTSPRTNQRLRNKTLTPNMQLKSMILTYKRKHENKEADPVVKALVSCAEKQIKETAAADEQMDVTGKLNQFLHFFSGKLVQKPSLRTVWQTLNDITNIGKGVESTKVLAGLFHKLAEMQVDDARWQSVIDKFRKWENFFSDRTPRENFKLAGREGTPKTFPSVAQTPKLTLPNPDWVDDSEGQCTVPTRDGTGNSCGKTVTKGRRHHCRLCGSLTRNSCSEKYLKIDPKKGPERFCKACQIKYPRCNDCNGKGTTGFLCTSKCTTCGGNGRKPDEEGRRRLFAPRYRDSPVLRRLSNEILKESNT